MPLFWDTSVNSVKRNPSHRTDVRDGGRALDRSRKRSTGKAGDLKKVDTLLLDVLIQERVDGLHLLSVREAPDAGGITQPHI